MLPHVGPAGDHSYLGRPVSVVRAHRAIDGIAASRPTASLIAPSHRLIDSGTPLGVHLGASAPFESFDQE
jgi:hypothetical protein